MAPSQWAVAGATTIASTSWAVTDVADPAVRLKRQDVGIDRVPAQRLERERPDELGRGCGHEHADVRPFGLEQAQQLDGFVRGDGPGDPEGDAAILEASADAVIWCAPR